MKNLKVGQNKGNARIWLEIRESETHYSQWVKGTRYDREITDEAIVITVASDTGKYKVSGKSGLSIIDISGKWLTKWTGYNLKSRECCRSVQVTIDSETILLKRDNI
jgi:hypothetical protein